MGALRTGGVLVLATLGGCGRLAFDESSSDATGVDVQLANHDEDHDGIDDAIDV